jgi:hypothetical protein
MALVTSSNEVVHVAGRHDNNFHIGAATYNTAGTNGAAWNATLKRYVRRITNTGYARLNDQLEPRSLVDPKYGTTPMRLRAREACCMTYTALPTGSPTLVTRCMWGYSGAPNSDSATVANFTPFVGFRMQYNGNLAGLTAGSTWYVVVIDDTLTTVYSVDTTISALAIHELSLLFDGRTSTVYFYIDGNQVGSYTFASGAAPGQAATYGASVTAASQWQMLFEATAANFGGVGAIASVFDFHIAPMTPLVTVEYLDATA